MFKNVLSLFISKITNFNVSYSYQRGKIVTKFKKKTKGIIIIYCLGYLAGNREETSTQILQKQTTQKCRITLCDGPTLFLLVFCPLICVHLRVCPLNPAQNHPNFEMCA